MEHFLWYCEFETVLMGYLANFLKEVFVAQCPLGRTCRCEERVLSADFENQHKQGTWQGHGTGRGKSVLRGPSFGLASNNRWLGNVGCRRHLGYVQTQIAGRFRNAAYRKEEFHAVQELAVNRVS